MKILVINQTSHGLRPCLMPPSQKIRGFSLVEVLISIIILSFGLLGMVGLQAAALQANREARMQSAASGLARELAEMMRGNQLVGLAAAGSNPYMADLSTPLTPTITSYCLKVSSTVPCAAADIATAQMTEWLSRVDSELPGARIRVCLDSAPFNATTGVPQWNCTTSASTDPTMVIKMGWTRGATDRTQTGLNALDQATVPALVLPVTAGVTH
jgi:type IV pilus assembly protein PilV